jgi:hypothetical protein
MENNVRYTKTTKGIDEIGLRQYNLTGKLRIMLILVDPSKTAEQLRMQGERLGAPADCLEAMVRDGYIAPVQTAATGVGTAAPRVNGTPVIADGAARIGSAKKLMKQRLSAGLGHASSLLAARIERCTTLSELAQLMPEYEKAIANGSGDIEADLLALRLRRLLA